VIILSTCKTKNPSWFIDEQLPEGFEPHDYIECPELKEAMRALLDSEAMRLIELMAFHHWDSRVRKYARRVHDEVEGFKCDLWCESSQYEDIWDHYWETHPRERAERDANLAEFSAKLDFRWEKTRKVKEAKRLLQEADAIPVEPFREAAE
jgi:hypothetical protein